jgi:hypothetical protein
MEAMDLFGVPMTARQESSSKEKQAKKKFVSDLLEVLTELDDEQEVAGFGGTQDFAVQKNLINFDPNQ